MWYAIFDCIFVHRTVYLMHKELFWLTIFHICLLSFSSSCLLCVWMLHKFKGRVWGVKRVQAVVSSFLSNLLTKEGNPFWWLSPLHLNIIIVKYPEKLWHSLPQQHCIFSVGQQEASQFLFPRVGSRTGHINRGFKQRCTFVYPHWSTCKTGQPR